MSEETKTATAPADKISDADFSPEAREELRLLKNIEGLLKRVKGLEGDEAFAYVEARQYVATRASLIAQAELARVKAERMVKAAEANGKATEAPATPAAA